VPQTIANIYWLGTKELRSFMRDFVLLGLVVYAFSLAIIAQAQSSSQEVHNASIAIVDEDHSELSRRIAHAFLPPYFQTPQPVAEPDIVPLMNVGRYTFVIDIPPNFNSITMLAIILAGAAVVREREHGTLDHLLVMPLTPFEIAMSKIWANGLVIIVAVAFSLYFVVRGLLGIPIAGSIPLFLLGAAAYLFFATAIGLFLGTVARSMPQLGLLYLLVYLPLAMLSGSNTPLESMPPWLATMLQTSPTVHFVALAQAILYRGAGFTVVWLQLLITLVMGGIFLSLAVLRFPRVVTAA
jgi:ABC-type transport system involved in multi-copper enzyme maturation permease subunit